MAKKHVNWILMHPWCSWTSLFSKGRQIHTRTSIRWWFYSTLYTNNFGVWICWIIFFSIWQRRGREREGESQRKKGQSTRPLDTMYTRCEPWNMTYSHPSMANALHAIDHTHTHNFSHKSKFFTSEKKRRRRLRTYLQVAVVRVVHMRCWCEYRMRIICMLWVCVYIYVLLCCYLMPECWAFIS